MSFRSFVKSSCESSSWTLDMRRHFRVWCEKGRRRSPEILTDDVDVEDSEGKRATSGIIRSCRSRRRITYVVSLCSWWDERIPAFKQEEHYSSLKFHLRRSRRAWAILLAIGILRLPVNNENHQTGSPSITSSLRGFYLTNQFILMCRTRRIHRRTWYIRRFNYLRQLDNIPRKEIDSIDSRSQTNLTDQVGSAITPLHKIHNSRLLYLLSVR